MHRKTTAAFVQFEPCVRPQPDIEFYAVVWAASHRVEMPPDRRRARAAGAAWPDLTFKTLSVTIAASVCFFRATRDVTNRRYFVISTGTGTRIQERSDCYVHIRRMKNTQAPRTCLRVLRHLRLGVTFPSSTYFNIRPVNSR